MVFLNDDDEKRTFVRVLFNREVGREPSAQEQSDRAAELGVKGADLVLAELRDSQEAQDFRAKRGW